MESICYFIKNDDSLQIETSTSSADKIIDIFVENSGIQSPATLNFSVKINEFKRIEREISKYLGLEIKE
jgi:hypothetical protein